MQQIDQWDEVYPDRVILEEDIAKCELYIGEIEEEIASVYVLNCEFDDEYKKGRI